MIMSTHKLRAYFYLGAFCTAIVALDYLPFGEFINTLAAIAVFAVEIWIAERILKQFVVGGSSS